MKASVFKKRRKELAKNLAAGSALILPSSPPKRRTGDVDWPYRPDSNLIYFTSFEEPDSCLLLVPVAGGLKHILFVQNKDSIKELWTGRILGPKAAKKTYRPDLCFPTEDFLMEAKKYLKTCKKLYYCTGLNPAWDKKIRLLIKSLKKSISVQDPFSLIAPIRMQKTEEEIKFIKKAVNISAEAHIEVMKKTRPGKTERELHGVFLSEIMKRGAQYEAYPGIFAAGPNGCILHYTKNNTTIKKNDLLLVDAGAEYNFYSADITRTFPASGKFNVLQKRIYNKLLFVQKTIIKELKPGLSFKWIYNKTASLISELLKDENILTGSLSQIIKSKSCKKYFPHGFGHLLGLDVHDITTPQPTIKPGFVLTIEPGLYFPLEDSTLKPGLRGMGLRIEDDVLITQKGARILSKKAPKEVKELESLIGQEL